MTVLERLRDKAASLPLTPGVYLMKNADGNIIYVGKSKKLRNRVSSYFTGHNHTAKTARMVSLVRDFDYILCDTEIEALTLENVLIKRHTPRYNIKLKDAKSYPYIKITAEEYPRIYVTRERRSDRGRYFGPYQGTSQAHAACQTVTRIFALPTCRRSFPRDIGRERPCLYRDMGRCLAPCTGEVSAEEYRERIRCAAYVLDGNVRATRELLTDQMQQAAERMEFERAATLRDSLHALERLSEKQKVVADARVNRDVFALHLSETEGVLALLSVRDGAVVNKNEFILSSCELTSPEDALSLIADYYDTAGSIPREVMLDFHLQPDDLTLLGDYLSDRAQHRITVRTPERGDGRALCDLALENAREAARQNRLEGEREDKTLSRLSELLALSHLPRRIEAYDISNLGNEAITASMVVYRDGRIRKGDYRSFTIRTTNGADDYGAMREVLHRRLSHIGDGSLSLGEAPDLVLLDGGVGHVHAVREVMQQMGLHIPLFGMMKDDYHKTRAITDGEREISIAQETNVYAFVYNLQEEAHRFAVGHTMKTKRATLTRSTLERIPGIGPKKAHALLAAMPLSVIRHADIEALCAVRGISVRDAEAIVAHYQGKGNTRDATAKEKSGKETSKTTEKRTKA